MRSTKTELPCAPFCYFIDLLYQKKTCSLDTAGECFSWCLDVIMEHLKKVKRMLKWFSKVLWNNHYSLYTLDKILPSGIELSLLMSPLEFLSSLLQKNTNNENIGNGHIFSYIHFFFCEQRYIKNHGFNFFGGMQVKEQLTAIFGGMLPLKAVKWALQAVDLSYGVIACE